MSAELDSLSSSLLGPCSLSSLADPELPDTAPPQSPAQQGGPTHQTSQPPSVGKTPLEAVGRPLQGQVVRGVEAATDTESLSSPVPQDQTLEGAFPEGKDHHSPNPSKGKGLPTSASEGPPRERDAAQELPLPEPKGDHSRPGKEPRATGQQARAPASGVSC